MDAILFRLACRIADGKATRADLEWAGALNDVGHPSHGDWIRAQKFVASADAAAMPDSDLSRAQAARYQIRRERIERAGQPDPQWRRVEAA